MRVIQTDFSVKFGPNIRCVGAQFKEKIRIHKNAHLHFIEELFARDTTKKLYC